MKSSDLIQWLLRNAGPVIRYRTLVGIVNEQDVGLVGQALRDMLETPQVVDWLEKLRPGFELNSLHSGNPNSFENVMGKLVLLGLRAGLQPFDNKTLPFRVWLADFDEDSSEFPFTVFRQSIVASFLSYAGYGTTRPVAEFLKSRLESLYSFACKPDFESIYVGKSEFRGIPKSYDKHRLVNPVLYQEQKFVLPWIHDIRGISCCDDIMKTPHLREKAESVIEFILKDEYQSLPWSYGIAQYAGRYYVIGWAVHLPGYRSMPEKREFAEMLLTLEMVARFKRARKSRWFLDALDYLEHFRTQKGTYLFPRAWLPEKKVGYWVGGLYMGLEKNRREAQSIELESTFWVLWIKHLAGLL
ncbi:MAG: hypothetical protein ACFFD3_05950 [Candidatus Thorarchaeota archaeon]